ncbi:MDR/zinc-dependent alcohol dehydrogenase-like family protein [Pelagerythrobacter rhizovicinus]|uniref:L-iditol 2-dehydrogenase n=1 Tax=Pelagerythrobacter rhizovicinus TaxID=2268576 RepID=A0A4Q2KQ80_9SPHN|nr:zinc-binding dehydrogenase [Pelagerythrobacter rhizovicinus]RXZ65431.1 L-iditol 2-dehydrogenase [Pelagerythrobacter rhizovicinus]
MSAATAIRAAVVRAPGDTIVEMVSIPEPGPGEVRVRLEGCGVCASNLGPWSGPEWQQFPLEPGELGHEGWGVVDAVGAGVENVRTGDRVATLSHRSYREMDVACADALVRLPPTLDGKPFPGEPLGCAFNIFERSDIHPDQTVAIIGIGFLGAMLTRLASARGAKVVAISRRQESLQLAAEMGAETTLQAGDDAAIAGRVHELTEGRMCPRVIECVGDQRTLTLAGELVGTGGRLIIAGYHQDGPRQVDMQAWNWKGIDVVNAHERDLDRQKAGIEQAIEAVADGAVPVERLFTHCYSIEQLGEALDATRDKPHGFVKALIVF